jgi:hypothetical protein
MSRHGPAIFGDYGVTCSCSAMLDWPVGWARTAEAARRVCLLHEHNAPEAAIFDLVRAQASADNDGAVVREAAASQTGTDQE